MKKSFFCANDGDAPEGAVPAAETPETTETPAAAEGFYL